MKVLSAKEARDRFDGNAAMRDPSIIDRVLEDINTRISLACSEADHICDKICISFRVFGNGSSEYSICYPRTFIERFRYNWNEGYLWVQLTKAEEAQVLRELEDAGYELTIAGEGTTFRNFNVAW